MVVDPLENQFENARLEGAIRDWDENPRDLFSLQLGGMSRIFGEWKYEFASNKHDFTVKIVKFGFKSRLALGNKFLKPDRAFSDKETEQVKAAVCSLFRDKEACKESVPFSSKYARFTGVINFESGWIESV